MATEIERIKTFENHATIPVGEVIRVESSTGAFPIIPGITVLTIVISLGPADLSVPDIVGETVQTVGGVLAAASMTKGEVSFQVVTPGSEYVVVAQDPSPPAQAGAGFPVNYTVGVLGAVASIGSRPRGRRH